tara:strand:+ start:27004 stop:28221 length:1218 start_codon:yes stop_codon:yes gene_type:complete
MIILYKMRKKITKQELIDFERHIANLWEKGKLSCPIHLSGGNEEQLIEIFKDIKEEDYVFSTHRSHYHYLLKGGSPKVLEKKILDGKSMHIFDKDINFLTSSIVAGGTPIAAGVALGLKKNKSKNHVWCFLGDGAEEEGHFSEAARYVDGWNLPCTFIIEDNNRSVATPKKDRYNQSEFNWPSCVKRYNYKSTYPHYDTGKRIDFSNLKIKKWYKKIKHKKEKSSKLETSLAYGEAIKQSMEKLAEDKKAIFIGYNIKYGTKAYGTLSNIPKNQLLETPLAENLMSGLAIGLALTNYKPVLFFERHDFMLIALDSLVNHLDKLEAMSEGQFKAPVLIRAVAGEETPLYPGPQHIQNFTKAFENLFSLPIYKPQTASQILETYQTLGTFKNSAIIIEKKELYSKNG